MIYFSSLFHVTCGILAGISALAMYISSLKNRSKRVQKLIMPFLSITFYSLFAGLPMFFTDNLNYINWWFLVALVFVFSCIATSYQLPLFSDNPKFSGLSKYLILSTVIIGIFVLILEYFDPILPEINNNGIIFWHMNPIGAYVISAMALVTGFFWGALFIDGSRLVTDVTSRLKAYILAADGVIVSISASLYFSSNNQTQTLISFLVMSISLLVVALVFTLAHLQNKKPSLPT